MSIEPDRGGLSSDGHNHTRHGRQFSARRIKRVQELRAWEERRHELRPAAMHHSRRFFAAREGGFASWHLPPHLEAEALGFRCNATLLFLAVLWKACMVRKHAFLYASRAELAKLLGCSERTVYTAAQEAQDSGWAEVVPLFEEAEGRCGCGHTHGPDHEGPCAECRCTTFTRLRRCRCGHGHGAEHEGACTECDCTSFRELQHLQLPNAYGPGPKMHRAWGHWQAAQARFTTTGPDPQGGNGCQPSPDLPLQEDQQGRARPDPVDKDRLEVRRTDGRATADPSRGRAQASAAARPRRRTEQARGPSAASPRTPLDRTPAATERAATAAPTPDPGGPLGPREGHQGAAAAGASPGADPVPRGPMEPAAGAWTDPGARTEAPEATPAASAPAAEAEGVPTPPAKSAAELDQPPRPDEARGVKGGAHPRTPQGAHARRARPCIRPPDARRLPPWYFTELQASGGSGGCRPQDLRELLQRAELWLALTDDGVPDEEVTAAVEQLAASQRAARGGGPGEVCGQKDRRTP